MSCLRFSLLSLFVFSVGLMATEKADAQLFSKLFKFRDKSCCCCEVEEETCEPEPEPCCCEPAPAPEPEPCCCEPAPAPEPAPCCCCCAIEEPVSMPTETAAAPPCPCTASTTVEPSTNLMLGASETLISISPLAMPELDVLPSTLEIQVAINR